MKNSRISAPPPSYKNFTNSAVSNRFPTGFEKTVDGRLTVCFIIILIFNQFNAGCRVNLQPAGAGNSPSIISKTTIEYYENKWKDAKLGTANQFLEKLGLLKLWKRRIFYSFNSPCLFT